MFGLDDWFASYSDGAGLAVVALVAVAALVALAGALLATPYLVVRTVRRRLAERHIRQPQPLAAESVVAT